MSRRFFSRNPAVILALIYRRQGWKRSQVDWPALRAAYERASEVVRGT